MAGEVSARDALHAAGVTAGITALAIDWLYTLVWWLVLGRDERRKSRHAELKYFLILGQLAAELAAIVHLAGLRKKVQE